MKSMPFLSIIFNSTTICPCEPVISFITPSTDQCFGFQESVIQNVVCHKRPCLFRRYRRHIFSLKDAMSSGQCRPFCLGLNVLTMRRCHLISITNFHCRTITFDTLSTQLQPQLQSFCRRHFQKHFIELKCLSVSRLWFMYRLGVDPLHELVLTVFVVYNYSFSQIPWSISTRCSPELNIDHAHVIGSHCQRPRWLTSDSQICQPASCKHKPTGNINMSKDHALSSQLVTLHEGTICLVYSINLNV